MPSQRTRLISSFATGCERAGRHWGFSEFFGPRLVLADEIEPVAPHHPLAPNPVSLKLQGILARHPEYSQESLNVKTGDQIFVSSIPSVSGVRVYTIQKGEDLSQIAQREMGNPVFTRGGSLERLLLLNSKLKTHLIHPRKVAPMSVAATRLVTPENRPQKVDSTVLGEVENTFFHIVRSGDSLVQIAKKYTLAIRLGSDWLEKVLKWNPFIKNPNLIFPRMKIAFFDPSSIQEKPQTSPERMPTSKSDDQRPAQSSREFPFDQSLSLMTGYRTTTLYATDLSDSTHATLRSQYAFELAGSWNAQWSQVFGTSFQFGMEQAKILPSDSSIRTISNLSQTLFHFRLEGSSRLSSNVQLVYGCGYEQDLFAHGLSSSATSVDAVPTWVLQTGIDWKAISVSPSAMVGLRGEAKVFSPSQMDTYNVYTGYGFSAEAYARTHRVAAEATNYSLVLGYEEKYQSSSVIRFNQSDVFFHVTFEVPWLSGMRESLSP